MPRVKQFDRDEVLTRAMELFWKKGYAATSVQDLVGHLGINRASLYDTYGDKEKLFTEAFEHYKNTNTQHITAFLQSEPDVKKGFRSLFERAVSESVGDCDRKGCFIVNTTTERVPGDEQLAGVLAQNKVNFEKIFFDYLRRGEESGQFASGKDLRSIATLLFTMYNGLRVVSKIDADGQSLKNSINVLLGLLD